MNEVLVTGGAGYIGSHAVQELIRAGVKTVVLDNLSSGHLKAVRCPCFYQGDIADSALVKHIITRHKIRSVIHFAARSLVAESYARPELYFYENTVKSFMFLEAARQAGAENIVFSSTAAVYGNPPPGPITERTGLESVNPYGASKRMIEDYLEWMGKVHQTSWVALRYFNAAGSSLDGSLGEDHRPETHLIPLVMHTALGLRPELSIYGSDYPTPDGTCIRDYINVVDLARAHVKALEGLEQGMASGVFNLGTGQGYSVMEIIEKTCRLVGHELPMTFKERRNGDPPILVADSSEIRSALDWFPQYSDLDTILGSAWKWHSKHLSGYSL